MRNWDCQCRKRKQNPTGMKIWRHGTGMRELPPDPEKPNRHLHLANPRVGREREQGAKHAQNPSVAGIAVRDRTSAVVTPAPPTYGPLGCLERFSFAPAAKQITRGALRAKPDYPLELTRKARPALPPSPGSSPGSGAPSPLFVLYKKQTEPGNALRCPAFGAFSLGHLVFLIGLPDCSGPGVGFDARPVAVRRRR